MKHRAYIFCQEESLKQGSKQEVRYVRASPREILYIRVLGNYEKPQ